MSDESMPEGLVEAVARALRDADVPDSVGDDLWAALARAALRAHTAWIAEHGGEG